MSQLQSIATRLRALAQDVSPLSTNVEASARQLNSLIHQVETLSRSGVNTGPLLAALQQAQAHAEGAADAATQVRSKGVAWADQLAGGGSSGGTSTAVGGFLGDAVDKIKSAVAGDSAQRRPLGEQREGEAEWARGSGDAVPSALAAIAAQTAPEGWASLINGAGISTPGRNNNCVDCSRAVESTWRGAPASSAAMADSNANGTDASRVTDWAGGELQPTTFDGIATRLQELGVGSSAIVVSSWPRRGGHAYNAINDGGTIKFVDGQSGAVSGWPPISWKESDTRASWAVFLNKSGKPQKK